MEPPKAQTLAVLKREKAMAEEFTALFVKYQERRRVDADRVE
jgi:hypothetical protein